MGLNNSSDCFLLDQSGNKLNFEKMKCSDVGLFFKYLGFVIA